MTRVANLCVAAIIAAAGPASAWCEATCLTPAHHAEQSTTPHCPSHQSATDGPSLTAGGLDDCPVVQSARTVTAKIDFVRPSVALPWHPAPRHSDTGTPRHLGPQALRHLADPPLRI